MIRPERMRVEDALQMYANADIIARKSADGRGIIIYTGQPNSPGSWLESDRHHIAQDGTVFVVNVFAARNPG